MKKRKITPKKLAKKILSDDDVHFTEFHGRKSAWDRRLTGTENQEFSKLIKRYTKSLENKHVSKRAKYIESTLKRAGYNEIEDIEKDFGETVRNFKNHQRYYVKFQDTMIIGIQFGNIREKPITEGVHVAGAHIDSPGIVARIRKLKENFNLGYMLCAPHGGIEPKDWFNEPMVMHFKGESKDEKGKRQPLEFAIGDQNGDPCFIFNEGSVHLTDKTPEIYNLEAILGSKPYPNKTFDPTKRIILNIMNEFYKRYGLTEKDFEKADIWFLPERKPLEIGIDKSMIGAYGQDNWAGAFALLQGFIRAKQPKYTKMAIWYDKEEIGDEGKGSIAVDFIGQVLLPALAYQSKKNLRHHYESMGKSWSMFVDVSGPINPFNPEDHDPRDSAFFSSGVVIPPHSGEVGRFSGNITTPEFMGAITYLFEKNKIPYQISLMGRADNLTANSSSDFHNWAWGEGIDIGISALGLHRTMETISKRDLLELIRAIKSFYLIDDHKNYLIKK